MEALPYRLTRILRDGRAFKVFEASYDDGQFIVVKQAKPGLDADDLARFRREISLSTLLDHPGLAATLAHGEAWVAFEQLGPSLAEHGKLSDNGASALLRVLAGTLAYLHARGIVHRDIKPSHVLFRGDQPVLIDLGVAGLVSDDPLMHELVGSPAWMAPEQVLGAAPSPAADIWSLCATIVFALTGERAYSGSADEVLARRRQGLAPTWQDLVSGSRLTDLLQHGLGEPSQRPKAADIVGALTP
jgi:serine/threonine protein kinase